MARTEIRLSGSGGQGLILAGVILAEAAAIYDEKNAIQSQSYGPEARGGASKSEVIIADGDIDYPKATALDLLLALTQEAAEKYIAELKDEAILIVDQTLVKEPPKGNYKTYSLPILKTAEEVGRAMVANIVSLGVIVGLTGVVTREAIEQAVLSRVPKGTEDLNKRALDAGFELAKGRE